MICVLLAEHPGVRRSQLRISGTQDRLENFPANPITAGSMRTATMVRAEVHVAEQNRQKQLAETDGGLTPVYQYGDYLLLRMSVDHNTNVKLHRIVHGILMQKARRNDATFTTLEYKHTPVN
eukprot:3734544-Pleurochrysis_carterae.AAC.1